MAAAIQISPASGSITAKLTAVNISCTGVSANDSSKYDSNKYPTEAAIVCRFRLRKSGVDDLLSNPFTVSQAGKAEWDSVVFPSAGSWTLTLRDTNGDTQLATASVTVN